jgi:hypothetical protein
MAVLGHSLSERISRWQVLISNLKEESPTLPHVDDDLTQLEALLPQARALQDRYEHFRAQAREVNADLAELVAEGDSIRGRIGANLRGKFGFASEALIRYGFKPQPKGRRRRNSKKAPQPEPSPVPAAAGAVKAEG